MSVTPRRTRSRLVVFTFTALALLVSSVAFATPASAHYELLSTDPAADSVVTALPDQLSLTFSGNLLADPGATVIEVVDSSGVLLTDGDPTVDGAVATQKLAIPATMDMVPSGPITVRWKVVYDDGHTGSDEFGFTIDAPTPTPTPTPTASPSPTVSPTSTPTPTPTPAPAPNAGGTALLPWLIGGSILVVVVAAAVTYLLVSRARRERALNGGDRGSSEPPTGR